MTSFTLWLRLTVWWWFIGTVQLSRWDYFSTFGTSSKTLSFKKYFYLFIISEESIKTGQRVVRQVIEHYYESTENLKSSLWVVDTSEGDLSLCRINGTWITRRGSYDSTNIVSSDISPHPQSYPNCKTILTQLCWRTWMSWNRPLQWIRRLRVTVVEVLICIMGFDCDLVKFLTDRVTPYILSRPVYLLQVIYHQCTKIYSRTIPWNTTLPGKV